MCRRFAAFVVMMLGIEATANVLLPPHVVDKLPGPAKRWRAFGADERAGYLPTRLLCDARH